MIAHFVANYFLNIKIGNPFSKSPSQKLQVRKVGSLFELFEPKKMSYFGLASPFKTSLEILWIFLYESKIV